MLPKFKILMLLAMMVAKCLSGLPNATSALVKRDHLQDLMKELAKMGYTREEFEKLVANTPFKLGIPMSNFKKNLMTALLDEPVNNEINVLVSPLNIFNAIVMLYLASPIGSTTHQQIADALDLRDENSRDYLVNLFGMLRYFKTHDTGLQMANGMFLSGGIPIEQDYVTLVHGFLWTQPQNLDRDPSKAVNDINEFISNNTKGLIPKLLAPGSIDQTLTTTVLVSALHHEGAWKFGFDKSNSGPMDFNLLDDKTVEIEKGMYLENDQLRVGYYEEIDSDVLELLYTEDFKMFVTLPKKKGQKALKAAAAGFDHEVVEFFLAPSPNGVEVLLPGFSLDFETDLVEYLETMGITDAFLLDLASFLRMTPDPIKITNMVHKVKVEVNEDGSKAAAATATFQCLRSSCKAFYVNRPFVVSIVDTKYKTPVITAVIVNPAGQKP